MRTWQWTIGLLALTLVARIAYSDESKVPLGDVPKAGLEAVKAMFPKAAVSGAAKETEDGKTFFEVTLKQDGRTIDVTVGTDGKIQLVEREIGAAELPKAVQTALDAKYPKAALEIAEEVKSIKDGKATIEFYEMLLVTADKKRIEVQIAPDGKIKNEEAKGPGKD